MSNYYNGCDDIPANVCNDCEPVKKGRILGVAFVPVGETFVDPSDPAEWLTKIAAGTVRIITNMRGEYARHSPVEADGYGSQSKQIVGRNHEVSYREKGNTQNRNFYNAINKSNYFELWYITHDNLYKTGAASSIDAGLPIAMNDDSIVEWDVKCKWSNIDLPEVFAIPEGVFECA